MYVFGQRVHEVALGIGLLALMVVGVLLGVVRDRETIGVCGAAGAWLVAKDWRDLFPRWRNTQTHRRFGMHLPSGSRLRRGLELPTVAALATLAVGAVNCASALTPNVGWRGHALLRIEPVSALPIFHAVAVPASVGLGLTAVYLHRRRRRALLLAIGLLLLLGVTDALKGLDFEEAALSVGVAAALWYGRAAFDVEHERLSLGDALAPIIAVGLTIGVAGAVSVWLVGADDPSVGLAGRETASLLDWRPPPLPSVDAVSFVVRALTLTAFLTVGCVLFRPRRPVVVTGSREQREARRLVRAYGRDTLSAFKLRSDLDYLFAPDRRSFVGYRVEGGVLLVAGDPVGPDDSVDALMREVRGFAAVHGLRLGGVGTSAESARRWRETGLRSLYVGDEAIVDTGSFSLEGRSIRKVRQAVSRVVAAGYSVELFDVAALPASVLGELAAISEQWRRGQPERGFAMATALGDPAAREGVVVLARDGAGSARGWLHYLPTYGRPAMSLALQSRDPETPNGLMEFLVVRSIELLGARGVEELSLNFAAFSRPLRAPRGVLDRLLGRVLRAGGRWFQIESLYRFNAKFFPRWEPRYLVFESSATLPRTALATLVAEGQLRRPTVTSRARLRSRPSRRSG